jgi:hypothetical protein
VRHLPTVLGQIQTSTEMFEDARELASVYPTSLLPTDDRVDEAGAAEGWQQLCDLLAAKSWDAEMSSPPG